MKNLKFKNLLFGLIAVLAVAVMMISCEQDGINPPIQTGTDDNQKIMDALCDDVHNCNAIEILEDAIIIDKCVHIDKDDMLEYLIMLENGVEEEPVMSKIPHPLDEDKMIEFQDNDVRYYNEQNNTMIEDRHRIAGYTRFAKNSEVTDIRYFIHQSASDCHVNNENAINEATSYWSSISNCRVKFSYTSNMNSADIIFGCDADSYYRNLSGHGDIGGDKLAVATFPNIFTRKVGKYISINDDYDSNTSLRKGVMIHEIGHCLGLAHTDENAGHQLTNSPDSDTHSIMNSRFVNRNEFSKEDLKMVRRLWPKNLSKPTNFSVEKEGSRIRIKFRNQNVGTGPYDRFAVRHWYAGSIQPTAEFHGEPDANGNYNFLMPRNYALSNGAHYFSIQGKSHLGEVVSSYSGWKYIVN